MKPDYSGRTVSTGAAGIRCACPRCGEGPLYQGLLTIRERCTVCDLDFSKLAADDGPAFFIIVVLSAFVLPSAAAVEMIFRPPIWVHMLLWPPLLVAGAIALMRPLKAWMIAQHYRHVLSTPDAPR
ncbi:MAG: DUF983 domain-containing protein [Alphaproteobacteria bacterium]|nr:DUF983 domain-containing protein [Alphaproteobacteria bacterium]